LYQPYIRLPRQRKHLSGLRANLLRATRKNEQLYASSRKQGCKNDMKVSSENALKGFVIFPKYEEQKRISEYFAVIDNLITLHQRKQKADINSVM
jgi:hypothetical protein